MDPIILKILNGVQSGVEVALADGIYSFGSDRDDDIQLVDVSLLGGHARLRIAGARIDISAQAGPLELAGGRILDKGGDWHALESLDVVVAGTTRFALGPRSANWASVADQGRRSETAEAERLPGPAMRSAGQALDWRLLAAPVLALVVVALAVGWLFVRPGGFASGAPLSSADGVHAIRENLDKFAFGRPVDVHDEVDGAIFVTGHVATPVERRALVSAVDKTGISARVRLYVLDDMRREIADLIAAQKVPVEFSLSDKGAVTLTGVVLSATRAKELEALIRERVFGVSDVSLKVRTADTILGEARDLLTAAQLNSWLLLRVVGDTLEVSGALPAEKVDAWVGFLQAYASRFAKDLPLRSFVQLQPSAGGYGATVAARSTPLGLGAAPIGGGATPLDLDKLRKGTFTLDDLFVGTRAAEANASQQPDHGWATAREAASAAGPDRPGGARPAPSDQAVRGPGSEAGRLPAALSRPGSVEAAAQGVTSGAPQRDLAPAPAGASPLVAVAAALKPAAGDGSPDGGRTTADAALTGPPEAAPNATATEYLPLSAAAGEHDAVADLRSLAASAALRFRKGAVPNDLAARDVQAALALIESRDNGAKARARGGKPEADWLLPVTGARDGAKGAGPCWSGTELTASDLAPTLFWLDVLSATRNKSLKDFDERQRILLLDVALNPDAVRACGKRSPDSAAVVDHSLYLREISRNPGFVDFLVRDLPHSDLDVVGVSLGKRRFVATRDGVRYGEGSAPNRTSRVAVVGELGLVVQRSEGLAVQVFGPGIGWLVAD